MTQTRKEALTELLEAADDVIRANNTMMLMLSGEMHMSKGGVETAIRRSLDARNAWDNARKALIAQEPDQ